ncbi:MAG: permease-like cell division protein FtsX, partial [Bacteroidales bacterium]
MIQEDEKYQKRRLRSSHITTVLSISLVLFLLGLQALMLVYSHKISTYVKENIGFTVVLKEFTREQDVLELKTILDSTDAVKSTRYISKEEAAKELTNDLGEDFVQFLGFNPLLPSIEVKLHADYTQNDSIADFESQIKRYHNVKEVYYEKDLVSLVNDNVKTISFWLLIISALVLFIAIMLINNTMRLLIYSKRLIINSMQLVGATSAFIRKPFLINGLVQGGIAALVASTFLGALLWYLHTQIPDVIGGSNDWIALSMVFILLISIGVIFTDISPFFAVNKFIKMRNNE